MKFRRETTAHRFLERKGVKRRVAIHAPILILRCFGDNSDNWLIPHHQSIGPLIGSAAFFHAVFLIDENIDRLE